MESLEKGTRFGLLRASAVSSTVSPPKIRISTHLRLTRIKLVEAVEQVIDGEQIAKGIVRRQVCESAKILSTTETE